MPDIYIPNILLAIPRNPVTAVGLPLVLGLASGWPSRGQLQGEWYKSLKHPPGRPGKILPPIMWSIAYFCSGYAVHLAVKALDRTPPDPISDMDSSPSQKEKRSKLRSGLVLYYAQLGLNLAYTPIFLGTQHLGLAFTSSGLMAALTFRFTELFHGPTGGTTTYFLAPYGVWLIYASYMSGGLWYLNRK